MHRNGSVKIKTHFPRSSLDTNPTRFFLQPSLKPPHISFFFFFTGENGDTNIQQIQIHSIRRRLGLRKLSLRFLRTQLPQTPTRFSNCFKNSVHASPPRPPLPSSSSSSSSTPAFQKIIQDF